MSVRDWPRFKVASFRMHRAVQAIPFKSMFGSQALTAGSPLWQIDMSGVTQQWAQANNILTWLESLDGYNNQVAMYNLIQPVPAGTMRGNLAFATNAAQGATTIQVTGGSGQAGRTLLMGDLIGLGAGMTQQVVRIAADAVADVDGLIELSIGTPLRNAFLETQSVQWDRPKALFRQKSLNEGIQYVPKFGQPWALSLIEDWKP